MSNREPAVHDLAALWQLCEVTDPITMTRALRTTGSPQDACHFVTGAPAPASMLDRAHHAYTRGGITAVTCLDDEFPVAWRDEIWAPAVLWRRKIAAGDSVRIAVTGALDISSAARARGGAAGAWMASRGLTTMCLADDSAGTAALAAAQTVSPEVETITVTARGLLAPGARLLPAAESIATPSTVDADLNTRSNAMRMLVSRADAVVIVGASLSCDLANTIRATSIPTVVLGPVGHWAAALVDQGHAVHCSDLRALTTVLTSDTMRLAA